LLDVLVASTLQEEIVEIQDDAANALGSLAKDCKSTLSIDS
jgi:hypothetical protein